MLGTDFIVEQRVNGNQAKPLSLSNYFFTFIRNKK